MKSTFLRHCAFVFSLIITQAPLSLSFNAELAFLGGQKNRKHPQYSSNRLQTNIFGKQNDNDENHRMAQIRSIQQSFYAADIPNRTNLDMSSGIITNLPLWRVQWTELPGRSNVLNVFEGQYTHMFETILHSSKPWYVGQLLCSSDKKNPLYGLNDMKNNSATTSSSTSRNTIIGTLLKIVDYRRMADGKILLLVQGLERFVLMNCVQQAPFSIGNVQLLPDLEEIKRCASNTEEDARAHALNLTFQWHIYDMADCTLPIRPGDDITVDDISAQNLIQLMPLVPFCSNNERFSKEIIYEGNNNERAAMTFDFSLENQLQELGYLQRSSFFSIDASLDDVEQQIWIAINDFIRSQSKLVSKNSTADRTTLIPPNLLFLLPQNERWHKNLKISTNISTRTVLNFYPSYRRQRRLSYAAICLLEHRMKATGGFESIKQHVLEIPSLRDRLLVVLSYFLQMNKQLMGEFQ